MMPDQSPPQTRLVQVELYGVVAVSTAIYLVGVVWFLDVVSFDMFSLIVFGWPFFFPVLVAVPMAAVAVHWIVAGLLVGKEADGG